MGDLFGKYTCITWNGCSVVDYMLASVNLLNKIGYFEVHELTPLSNHCLISCSLVLGFLPQNNPQCKLDPLPNKFIWNQDAINLYIQKSNSADSKSKLDNFLHSNFTDTDEAVGAFNSILIENASQSAKLVKRVPLLRGKRKVN